MSGMSSAVSAATKATMSTSLCLACCGSLPPSAREQQLIFFTRCCGKPICPSCLAANPRLSRYNPCLACLHGVRAVAGGSSPARGRARELPKPSGDPAARDLTLARDGSERQRETEPDGGNVNLDGSLRDEDVFVVGDEDDEVDGEEDATDASRSLRPAANSTPLAQRAIPPSAYTEPTSLTPAPAVPDVPARPLQPTAISQPDPLASPGLTSDGGSGEGPVPKPSPTTVPGNSIHYIRKGDTLLGIALKYNIDGRLLCRLNGLPPSTLSTTPHILHTRTVLALPHPSPFSTPADQPGNTLDPHVNDKTAEGSQTEAENLNINEIAAEAGGSTQTRTRARALERVAKRFQLVTKEEDWRVASAYVALASSSSSSSLHSPPGPPRDAEDEKAPPVREKAVCGPAAAAALATGSGSSSMAGATAARAVDAYLDDDAWEAAERARGRRPGSLLVNHSGASAARTSGRGPNFGTTISRWIGSSNTTNAFNASNSDNCRTEKHGPAGSRDEKCM